MVKPVLIPEPDTNALIKRALPKGYEKLLNDALTYQFRTDSLVRISDSLKRKSVNYSPADKQKIRASIIDIEKLAAADQKLANESLAAAESMIHPKKVRDSVNGEKVIPVAIPSVNIIKPVVQPSLPVIRKDSALAKKEEIKPNFIEVFAVFDIKLNPVFGVDEKVPVNSEVEPGLIYRIQVAVFKNPVPAYYFKGLTPVFGFKSEGSDITKYYAGMFRKSSDASKALTRIKTSGFKDAIVVALFDKKIVSFERATILEKEWGKKPFLISGIKTADKQRDTIPSTLIFRVEVANSPKPLPEDQVDKIKRLAGNRGLEIMINATQQNVYLIGKFLTFESAADYADLLIRNGQKEAKVAAYLGKKEIPVETAKQLFEKLE